MMKYEEEEINEFKDDKKNESVEMTKNTGIFEDEEIMKMKDIFKYWWMQWNNWMKNKISVLKNVHNDYIL